MTKLRLHVLIGNAIDALYHSGLSINEIVEQLGIEKDEEFVLGIIELREQLQELDKEMGGH
jgi:hypothetical protein